MLFRAPTLGVHPHNPNNADLSTVSMGRKVLNNRSEPNIYTTFWRQFELFQQKSGANYYVEIKGPDPLHNLWPYHNANVKTHKPGRFSFVRG